MIACTVVYVFHHLLLSRESATAVIYALGVIPALVTGHATADFTAFPPALTVLTSMFVHGGFWHLAGNMLYLWIFGNNVEEAMGHVKFLVFYLLCGVAAVAAQVLPNPASEVPMVGASGAISGVLGAYMLLYPRARVLLGLPLGFVIIELGRWPAIWVLIAWFAMQLVMGALSAASNTPGGVAFGAHVGGFVAGCLLVTLFKHRGVPLWRRY
jgi:membrane associated rhomboid family serine protease